MDKKEIKENHKKLLKALKKLRDDIQKMKDTADEFKLLWLSIAFENDINVLNQYIEGVEEVGENL